MFNKTSNPFAKPQPSPQSTLQSTLQPTPQNARAGAGSSSAGPNAAAPGAAAPAPSLPTEKPAPTETVDTTRAATIDGGSRLIVGPDVKLKSAEILDCDTLVVEGRVEATMDSRVIRIAEQGLYTGKVSIDIAEIHGQFEGELTARSQLLIHATGKVCGKVRYGKMLIEEGGQISGEIRSLAEEEAAGIRPRQEILATVKAVAG